VQYVLVPNDCTIDSHGCVSLTPVVCFGQRAASSCCRSQLSCGALLLSLRPAQFLACLCYTECCRCRPYCRVFLILSSCMQAHRLSAPASTQLAFLLTFAVPGVRFMSTYFTRTRTVHTLAPLPLLGPSQPFVVLCTWALLPAPSGALHCTNRVYLHVTKGVERTRNTASHACSRVCARCLVLCVAQSG
jgi:hypothetical protein